jgi:pyruvate dehydrogenase E2 component (dihydrolipoamide acetyltransferase)
MEVASSQKVLMGRFSDSMEEGTVLAWLVDDGATVSKGEEIVEVETDKATMVVEAEIDGILRIIAQVGETLPVGAPIAAIGDGSDPPNEDGMSTPARTPVSGQSSPPPNAPPHPPSSPLARRIAREHGLDLARMTGTGPGGRIVKADVLAAIEIDSETAVGSGGVAAAEERVVEPTRGQLIVARRMVEARSTVPAFEVSVDVDMETTVSLRAEMRELASDGEVVPSFNDFVVRACAVALREMPRVNGSYRDDRFILHPEVNVGIAVAAEDALLVPTIFGADRKSVAEIAVETRRLAEQVRDGAVTPAELAGGTFTVSNLGMFGADSFTAVPNPPQAAILAVGSINPRVVPYEGTPVVRRTMTLTLTADHRILYGADSARFLARVRALLERPLQLVLPSGSAAG